MSWYYVVDGASHGPVEEAEMSRLSPGTLVWQEGMAAWIPLRESPLAATVLKPNTGAMPQFVAESGKMPLTYASIGRRFGAILIDAVIVSAVLVAFVITPMLLTMTLVVGPNHQILGQLFWYQFILSAVSYGLGPAYEIFFVGRRGATPGKMLLGIKVVTPDGGRISYALSTDRFFAKILSGMILCIGYLIAFWDPERRALHDRICDTRVINKER